jgi:hypothetical protein
MTINLSEERHDSDCCYLAGDKQQAGGLKLRGGSFADAFHTKLIICVLHSSRVHSKKKKASEYVQASEAEWEFYDLILFFLATIRVERIYMEGSVI